MWRDHRAICGGFPVLRVAAAAATAAAPDPNGPQPTNRMMMLTKSIRPRHGLLVAISTLLTACATAAPAPQAGTLAPASAAAAAEAAQAITQQGMARRIGLLAADSMRGRDTPSPELEAAARYIAGEFRAAGLQPAGDSATFLQRWPYEQFVMQPEQTFVRIRGGQAPALVYGSDFFVVPGTSAQVSGRIFFAGQAGAVTALPAEARGTVVLFELEGAEPSAQWQQRLTSAVGAGIGGGAAAVGLVLDPGFSSELVHQLAPAVAGQQAPVPVFGVTRRGAEALVAGAGARIGAVRPPALVGQVVMEVGAARVRQEHRPPNVVGVLRGADPVLRDTYVVLTAHFDHVGVGAPDATGDSIYNGADDNASGTSALMEIAHAFARLPEPPLRSVVFLAVSGEEKGLLGSMYYAQNPTVPAEGIIANINMDMISRNAPDTLIAIGQEYSTFADILDEVLARHPEVGLTVIRDPYPQEQLFFRSDQLSFIQQGVPALFFFTGLHEDYHRPSDTPERADPEKAARVAQLSFLIAHYVATTRQPPEWTEEGRRQVEAILRGGR